MTAAATAAVVENATPAAAAAPASRAAGEGQLQRAALADASHSQPQSVASAASSGGSGSGKRRHDSLSKSAQASPASASAGRSSSSLGPRSDRWLVPHPESLAALVDTDAVVPAAPAHKKSRKSVAASISEQAEEREKAQFNVDRWLLLTANGALQCVDISRAAEFEDKSRPAAHLTEPHAALVALLTRLRARVDFQDEDGFSAVVRSNPHATRTPTRTAAPRGSLLSSNVNVHAAPCLCALSARSTGFCLTP